MNSLGVHALVFIGGWSEPESERAINAAAIRGFQFLEVPLLDPERIDPRRLQRQLERARIGAIASLSLDPTTDISSGDPEVVARGEELLGLAVSVTRDIGAALLTGVLYAGLGRPGAPPTEAGRWNCISVLGRIAERAAKAGLTLALEPVNRYDGNLVNTAAQALELIDEIGADNIAVHLDSYHMNIEEGDPAAAIERCGARLAYVQASESHRGYLGTGTVDFGALFRALARIGYRGVITFEAYSTGAGNPRVNAELAVWRQLWTDGDDLARQARQFMAAQSGAALRSTS